MSIPGIFTVRYEKFFEPCKGNILYTSYLNSDGGCAGGYKYVLNSGNITVDSSCDSGGVSFSEAPVSVNTCIQGTDYDTQYFIIHAQDLYYVSESDANKFGIIPYDATISTEGSWYSDKCDTFGSGTFLKSTICTSGCSTVSGTGCNSNGDGTFGLTSTGMYIPKTWFSNNNCQRTYTVIVKDKDEDENNSYVS